VRGGAFLAVKGFWPILPFAGARDGAASAGRSNCPGAPLPRQTITVTDADVSIESRLREAAHGSCSRRHWAQVKLRRPKARLHPEPAHHRVGTAAMRAGQLLTEEERRGLALACSVSSGRVNESPSWRKAPGVQAELVCSFEMRRLRRKGCAL